MALSLTAAICAGCTTTDRALLGAATAQGRAKAGVTLPDLPPECRAPMGRVAPKEGEKWRWVQKRWEFTADAQDKRTRDCAAFFDDMKAGLETGRASAP